MDTARAGAVRVRVAGTFAVELGGHQLDEQRVGSRKARLLLKMLAAARGRVVPMDQLVEHLWGNRPPAKADANTATLVSRLRRVLGTHSIVGGRSGYRIDTSTMVSIDVDEAATLVDEAEVREASGQPALALTAARAAVEMLGSGAVFEEEPAAEWAIDLGHESARLVRRARAVAWRCGLAVGDPRNALAVARDAIAADVLDEEAHRAVMRAYHSLDEVGEALRAYSELRRVLREELGADPGPETQALHTAILRGEPVPDETHLDRPVAGIGSRVTAATAGEPDFAGRDEELARLLDAWSTASRGVSTCVLVSGQAGIGKTRLASELAANAQAAGATVLQVRCYEPERSLFLQPIVDVVRAATANVAPDIVRRAAAGHAGPLARLVPEVDRLLRPHDDAPASGEIERRRTFEAVAAFLAGLGRQRPTVIVLDDLHHASVSTLELLHFMLRWDPSVPLLAVATVRTDEANEIVEQLGPLSSRLDVGPLPEDAVRSLARTAGFADLATAIIDKTRGHTLFVVEALRALSAHEAPQRHSTVPEIIPMPDSLRAAVHTRVQRCGEDVEEILRAASVVGVSFDITTVAALLALEPADAAGRAARAAQAGILIEQEAGYDFANDVLRDVLYDTTPQPTRIVRHRQLASVLARQPEAAAFHAAAAGDLDVAVARWLEAGSHALDTFANGEADRIFSRALDAATMLDDLPSSAAARLGRGRARAAVGDYAGAADDLAIARQLARATGSTSIETAALTELAWCVYYARDLRRAGDLAREAANHPASGPRAQVLLGRMRNTVGDLAGAVDLLEPLTSGDTDPATRASALSCLGTALAHSDRYDAAIHALDDAVPACRHAGMLRGLLNAEMFGCYARANLGDFDGALVWAEQLRTDAERFDASATYLPRCLNMLAWVWRELGDMRRSHDLAEEALERCGPGLDTTEGEPAANALLALAECALVDGDDAAAHQRLDDISPLLSDRVGFRWRIELRQLELSTRVEPPRAEELLDLARRRRSAKYEALALAHLGRSEDAVAAAQRTGSPLILARVAPEQLARQTFEQLTLRLPAELRDGFAQRGLLARALAGRG